MERISNNGERNEFVTDDIFKEEKPTLLTADVELAERAKSYEFEYILIVNNNTSNKATVIIIMMK